MSVPDRGNCANPNCFYIDTSKRTKIRKVCSIVGCSAFLCPKADCHKVHAAAAHPDQPKGSVTPIERHKKDKVAVPELLAAYRGHSSCSCCRTHRANKRHVLDLKTYMKASQQFYMAPIHRWFCVYPHPRQVQPLRGQTCAGGG